MVALGEHLAVEVRGILHAHVHLGEVVVVLHGLVVEPDALPEGGGRQVCIPGRLEGAAGDGVATGRRRLGHVGIDGWSGSGESEEGLM